MPPTQKTPLTEHEEFMRAITPLMEYLKEKYHPHVTAIVTSCSAEILEGIRAHTLRVSDEVESERS